MVSRYRLLRKVCNEPRQSPQSNQSQLPPGRQIHTQSVPAFHFIKARASDNLPPKRLAGVARPTCMQILFSSATPHLPPESNIPKTQRRPRQAYLRADGLAREPYSLVLGACSKGDDPQLSKVSHEYDKTQMNFDTIEIMTSKRFKKAARHALGLWRYMRDLYTQPYALSQVGYYFQGHKHGKLTDGVTALNTAESANYRR